MLIFLHIPKAGGTTLQEIIGANYASGKCLQILANTATSLEHFRKMSDADKKRFQIVCGHLTFGLHDEIPAPCQYFTMLREPVDRVVSNYYYVKRTPQHYLHQRVNEEKMTLADYMASKLVLQLDNGQTRMISGAGDTVPFGSCSETMLEAAKSNLQRHFGVVGLMEEFDQSVSLMKKQFGWRNVKYRPANVTPNRPACDEIDGATRAQIENCNQFDQELYEFARDLFQERVAACSRTHVTFSEKLQFLASDLFSAAKR